MNGGEIAGIVFGGIAAGATLLAGHAWLMNVIIDRAIGKALLGISNQYMTKEEFNKHIEHCPNMRAIKTNAR